MTHLEIALSITSVVLLVLFLGAIVYNSFTGASQVDLYTHYKVLWSKAEQDNKWLREYLAYYTEKVKVPGPKEELEVTNG